MPTPNHSQRIARWQHFKKEISPVNQTQQHPWAAVAVSVAAGAAAGTLLARAIDGKKSDFAFLERFKGELEMARQLLFSAMLKKAASVVKEVFPSASESVEKVMRSALTKVEKPGYSD